jgi:hypothetical protein
MPKYQERVLLHCHENHLRVGIGHNIVNLPFVTLDMYARWPEL